MKKLQILHFTFITLCATLSGVVSATQPTAALEKLGLTYGSLNHIADMNTFDKAIATTANIVVKISATWCPPCQKMAPLIVQLAQEIKSVLFIEVDLDSFRALANRYGIRSVPALLLFKNGTQITQSIGYKNKGELSTLINSSFGL
jgi:thioredoxin 1